MNSRRKKLYELARGQYVPLDVVGTILTLCIKIIVHNMNWKSQTYERTKKIDAKHTNNKKNYHYFFHRFDFVRLFLLHFPCARDFLRYLPYNYTFNATAATILWTNFFFGSSLLAIIYAPIKCILQENAINFNLYSALFHDFSCVVPQAILPLFPLTF